MQNRPGPNKLLEGCSFNVGPGDCLADKRATFKLFEYDNPMLNSHQVVTHKSCQHNEEIALSQRHQVDDGSRYSSKLDLKKYLRPLVRSTHLSSEEHIISRCAGQKRKLLETARLTLQTSKLHYKDAKVKMFLKDDKYLRFVQDLKDMFHQEVSESLTAPRCIQYRNKRYCLRLAQFLHPIEQAMYDMEDDYKTKIFAKSRNLKQRGEDLYNKWKSFKNPKAILLDHSKFDAHCSTELLRLEHWFYQKCHKSKELRSLLKWQLSNRGWTKNGTSYITKATRMSGDQNTGLGNSLINYAMIKAYCSHLKLKSSIYVDGDDSVVIYEDDGINHPTTFFGQFGMSTKVDYTKTFEHVEFCQTRPVYDGQSWHCVRNPLRLLSRLPWTVREEWARKPKVYLASVGRCELALGMGLPVGQYIGGLLAGLSDKHILTPLEYVAKLQAMRPRNAFIVHPSDECRMSYEKAWGLSPDEQRSLEAMNITECTEDAVEEEFPFAR